MLFANEPVTWLSFRIGVQLYFQITDTWWDVIQHYFNTVLSLYQSVLCYTALYHQGSRPVKQHPADMRLKIVPHKEQCTSFDHCQQRLMISPNTEFIQQTNNQLLVLK